jgi:hypothetical protein
MVTPAPAAPGAGRGRPGPAGAGSAIDTALTADSGVISGGQGRLIVLALTIAAGVAAAGAWLTMAGPGRRMVSSLASRRGRRTR